MAAETKLTESSSYSEDQFDRCSTSSSLEIVDALTEAAEDTPANHTVGEGKEGSPALSVLSCPDLVVVEPGMGEAGMGEFQDAMTQSQYAQVIFEDIEDSYQVTSDLVCGYSLTPGLEQGHGDRVGLYRLPFLQPHESVAYVWAGVGPGIQQSVTFPKAKLPKQEDFYQFQYLQGDNSVAGASIPFQLLGEPGDKALQEELGGLESKYSGLLQLSEKLSEELNSKTQSFVVLEQEHKSMCVAAARTQQLEADLEELVASSLCLKQTLRATEETLGRTEAVLNATTTKLGEAERAIELKIVEATKLEAQLGEVMETKEERQKLVVMLEQEQRAREGLLEEKASLLGRIEDGQAMLGAAVRSKDLAVEEIRSQVARQDELRKELAQAREELGRAEADLLEARKEGEVREAVVASLGLTLERREREVAERERELELMRLKEEAERMELELVEERKEDSRIEIHERCLEDADRRAEVLEKEKRKLETEVARLEQEGMELKARLEAGALHYRKLAAAKEKLERQQGEGQVAALEEQVRKLREELSKSRTAQELQLSDLSRQVSRASSFSATGMDDSNFSSLSSGISNMDSVKIGVALEGAGRGGVALGTGPLATEDPVRGLAQDSVNPGPSQQQDQGATGQSQTATVSGPTVSEPTLPVTVTIMQHQPSLFQPFSPSHPSLPPPLLPDVTHSPVSLSDQSIPELRPRVPAPYSSRQEEAAPVEEEEEAEEVHCPWCNRGFPAGGQELELHVEQHLLQVLDCPVCGKMYDKSQQEQFEEHVQDHFKEQGNSLVDISIRGWDLGID